MNYPKSRRNNLVTSNQNGELLIYDLNIDKAFCRNETSAAVWNLCDETKSASEIAEMIGKNLKFPVSEDFVWLAISDLQKENLIETGLDSQSFLKGKTRREIIRKIGLASMVALPVISSLVAPQATNAQSGGCSTVDQSCSFNGTYTQRNCCTSNLRCTNDPTIACRQCITTGNPYVSGPLDPSDGYQCQQACLDSSNQKKMPVVTVPPPALLHIAEEFAVVDVDKREDRFRTIKTGEK